jgi:hypothetical protein
LGHDASSWVDNQNERSLALIVPRRGDPGTNISKPRSRIEDPISDKHNLGAKMNDKASLNDPRNLYPAPPFPDQSQAAPGLARRMDPTPDHGEKSYRGSGKLTGRKALVTGGDSGIGRAAAIAFAREAISPKKKRTPRR